MQNTDSVVLIADIGGTNARFAFAIPEQPYFVEAQTFQVIDFDKIEDAVEAYLATHQFKKLSGICFAVAGPILAGNVSFTNNHWSIETLELAKKFSTPNVHLLNDFTAIAYSLPLMQSDDLIDVGGQWSHLSGDNFSVGVLGPGSGLGIAGLSKIDNRFYPAVTEGGHISFAPVTKLQIEILDVLRKKYDRVSLERVLSGPGLMNIHEAMCDIVGHENPGLPTSEIAIAGTQGSDEVCEQSMNVFFEMLGQAAGDVSLMLGAREGIFIGGGIVQRYPDSLQQSNFRAGFENKGRYRQLMEMIPTWLIERQNPGLVGCSAYALTSKNTD